MRRFVMGDIHGAAKALDQVLLKCEFDFDNDKLIFLGDACDGWPETRTVLEIFSYINDLIWIRGNHDQWFMEYYNGSMNAIDEHSWKHHGGVATLDSVGRIPSKFVKEMFNRTALYHIEDGMLFVHAGYDPKIEIQFNTENDLMWSRNFVSRAYELSKFKNSFPGSIYDEIYIGHTPVNVFKKVNNYLPQIFTNVIAMDTGAAFKGPLSVMDIDTKQVFQSDPCMKLYPDYRGRNKRSYNYILNKI